MLIRRSSMGIPFLLLLLLAFSHIVLAQDYDAPNATATATATPDAPPPPPPEIESCNGIFLSYTFQGREKEYPHVKNVTAQSWSFKATASILNAGAKELKQWKMFIGFQHNEMLVSADGGMVADGDSFPLRVGNNGTVVAVET